MKLLISKIGDVAVTQIGESSVNVKNKSEDASIVGGSKQGVTRTIDIGKGAEEYTVTIRVEGRDKNRDVYGFLHKIRKITIVDKYNGELSVYVLGFTSKRSENDILATIYTINFVIQDENIKVESDFHSLLRDEAIEMSKLIKERLTYHLGLVGTSEYEYDIQRSKVVFKDAILDEFYTGVYSIIEKINFGYSTVSDIALNVSMAKKILLTGCKNIKESIDDIFFVVDMICGIESSSKNRYENTSNDDINAYNDTGVFYPRINDVEYISLTDWLSSQTIDEYSDRLEISKILNIMSIVIDINTILSGWIKTKNEVNNRIKSLSKKLHLAKYENKDIEFWVTSYINRSKYARIVDYPLKYKAPLIEIVYRLYGNLSLYNEIRELNNIKDGDMIRSNIKVYDDSSS